MINSRIHNTQELNNDMDIINGNSPVLLATFIVTRDIHYSNPYIDTVIKEGAVLECMIYSNGRGVINLGSYPGNTGVTQVVDDLGRYLNSLNGMSVKEIYFKNNVNLQNREIVNRIIEYYLLQM